MKYKINKVIVRNLYSEVMTGECINGLESHRVIIKTAVPPIFGTTLKRITEAMRLDHCGIPKIVDFGECSEKGIKKYYITNMHIGGITLTQLLRRLSVLKLKIPGSVMFYILTSISDILEYTHRFSTESSGFMFHGNICPDNILLSFDGSVFLTDTGIADLLTYRYNGIELVKNKFSVFNHPDIHKGKICRKDHEFYSLGILLLYTMKYNDDFLLCMDKLDRGKNGQFTDVLLSLEPQIRSIVARLIGEKLAGVSGAFSSIEEVKVCLDWYIKENGIENGKNHLLLLINALFRGILQFSGNIREKVQKLIVDEQCLDGSLISILQNTVLNTQTQDKFSAIIQDYKTETESIPLFTVSECMNESSPESGTDEKNLPEQEDRIRNRGVTDALVIEEAIPAAVNPQKNCTSVFDAFSGLRVDNQVPYIKEKIHPFERLIKKR